MSKRTSERGGPISEAAENPASLQPAEPDPASAACRVVAVGASAGGLDAITRLVRALPAHLGMAIVIVQHLDPTHASHLAEILSSASTLPVVEISDGIKVRSEHVYVMPAKAELTLSAGVLRLRSADDSEASGLPIDEFLGSVARECGDQAVGVILSGAGNDGTVGLGLIRQAGGLTFAEDPEAASYDSMPRSAIEAGVVDEALSPEDLAQVLASVRAGTYEKPTSPATGLGPDDSALADVIELVHAETGLDLLGYRRSTLLRRIRRRMQLTGVGSLRDYSERLHEDRDELQALYRDVLVNVTEFFRDPDVLDVVVKRVFPQLEQALAPDRPLRVWVAGCSRGQEAYSIAILISEALGKGIAARTQVFATDVNASDIEIARAGVYPESIENEVSEARLRRFFDRVPGGYRVAQSVRDMCVFAVHDVLQDPPFSNIDLISCRNVLIYMERPLQERVFQILHYALRPGGFLILGTAETVAADTSLFSSFDDGAKVFSRSSAKGGLPAFGPRRHDAGPRPSVPSESLEMMPSEVDDLRTANEELQTAQEELQSTNEELTTLNDELRVRNSELQAISDDLRNVLEGAEIPILILDNQMRIRRFTPQSSLVVNILPTDVGRPITDFRLKVGGRALAPAVEAVLRDREPSQTEVRDDAGHWYSMRIRPFRTESGEYDGAVVAFFDVNELKRWAESARAGEETAQTARRHADAVIETVRDALLTVDDELRVLSANRAFYRLFATDGKRTIGVPLVELGSGHWNLPELVSRLEDLVRGGAEISGLRVDHDFEHIGRKSMLLDATIVRESPERGTILIAIHDVTELEGERARAEALLRISLAVSSTLETESILPRVIREASLVLGARSGALFHAEDDQWRVAATYGLTQECVGRQLRPAELAASYRAIELRAPLALSDVGSVDELRDSVESEWEARSVLMVPLLLGDTVAGSVGFHYADPGREFSESEIGFASRLGTLLSLALEIARRHEMERHIATTLQDALLTTPRRIPGIEFGYLYRSATEAASVGGDFFDLIELDGGRVGLLIGDVSGKGIEAATLTSLVKNTIRALAYESDSPGRIMATANDIVFRSTPSWSFVTLFFGILDTSSGHLVYARAGHPYPVIRRRDGRIDLLEPGSPLVGVESGVEFDDHDAELDRGDTLVLYTDGVTEARRGSELLGQERLVGFVSETEAVPTRELPEALFSSVLDFTGGSLSDDLAIVSVMRP